VKYVFSLIPASADGLKVRHSAGKPVSSAMLCPPTRRGRVQMTNASDTDEPPDNPPKPIKPPGPQRGAFPTPKSEIEKAKPYIPDEGEEDNDPEEKPDRPAGADGEEEG
jgi:hypothetical protein